MLNENDKIVLDLYHESLESQDGNFQEKLCENADIVLKAAFSGVSSEAKYEYYEIKKVERKRDE